MLTKLSFRPGINRDGTNYTNTGGWFDSDYVRFRNGMPEKIGGWTKVYANQTALIGKCRKMYDWSDIVGNKYLAIPTNVKFYVDNSASIIDITPLRRSVTLGTDPIATANTSSEITITDVNHGAVVGDYITVSGSSNVNGILSTEINKEFVVTAVANANAYSVVTTGTANATGSGGGSSVSVKYQFHPGASGTVAYTGWGSGPWGGISGQYGWGYGPTTNGMATITYSDGLWSVDNYGEDMVACPRDVMNSYKLGTNPISTSNTSNVVTVTQVNHGYSNGTAIIISDVGGDIGGVPVGQLNGTHEISVINANAFSFVVANAATSNATGGTDSYTYTSSLIYWDVNDLDGPAISFSELGSAYAKQYLPYVAKEIMVSDQNRQIIAFGCNPFDTTQPQDPMIVRWSDSSDPTNWDASDTTTTSGETRLSSGSYIVTAVQNREEILIWTDSSLFSMVYTGSPYGYGFNLIGANFDIIGPNSKIVSGSVAYWMGSNNFFMYDGKIQVLPCTVRDYVFLDLSREDGNKVYCSSDSGNNEIIWFYPSESQGGSPGAREVDRYVVFNYVENAWYYGTMARTAWIDRRSHTYPRSVSTDGYLYNQEFGFDDGSTNPPSPVNAYIQSSPVEIQDGNNFMFVNRVIPDLTFRNSTTNNGNQPIVKFTIKPQDYPGAEIGAGDERDVQRSNSATLTVNRFTNQVFTRLRARSVALRVESDETGVAWRLGTPRLDMRQDGRR
jgi:hypothetical protein